MRARSSHRVRNAVQIAAGALLLAAPVATAASLSGSKAHASSSANGTATVATTTTSIDTSAHTTIRKSDAHFTVHRKPRYGMVGQTVALPGHLHGAGRHARVTLQQRRGHRWIAIGHVRAGRHGGFTLRYRVTSDARVALRVYFRGSRRTHRTSALVGDVVAFAPTVASWYYDNGGVGTACGFKATYGVANKTLPCGTKVTFEYRGRTVTATVDDRGPYVAGRSYDLGVSTAAALGMQGVQTINASL